MNHIFIINPESGKKKGLYIGQAIDQYLKGKNIKYKIEYTTQKNDATRIANIYGDSDNIIYSVGGDGTLNEVVNSVATTDATLSIIPVGSGNDFCKSLKDFNGEYIDLGIVNDKYFINVASIGLDAEIANYANTLKDRKLPNKAIYVLSLIRNFFKYNALDIELNGDKEQIILLAICNGSFYGGGFQIAPSAELDDGLFDVYNVPNLNKLETLKLLSKLIKSTHAADQNLTNYKCDGLLVESEMPLLCNIDGEIITSTSFNFGIYQEAIRFLNTDELGINKMLKKKGLLIDF